MQIQLAAYFERAVCDGTQFISWCCLRISAGKGRTVTSTAGLYSQLLVDGTGAIRRGV